LNESALKTNNNEDSKPDDDYHEDHSFNFETVPEVEDTFKMPESFDIPQDYIKEIFPNKSKVVRATREAEPKQETSKTHVKSKPEDLEEIPEDNNTSSLEDEVVQITYKKDSTSKRNQGIKGKLNPKRDRKKMMADLFNDSDSDQEEKVDKSPTPSSSISLSDLEEKRNRVKEKLSGEKEKSSPKKSLLSQARKQKLQMSKPFSQNRNEEDEKFVVPDHESSVSDSDEEPHPDMTSESEADERRKRLEDRKKKKGGDVLAWMNKSAKVKVNVQTNPKSFIQDMAQYKLRLHFLEDSSDSEPEKVSKSSKSKEDPKSESESSDDSIPRGRRINPLKSSSSSDSEDGRKRRVIQKKKKKKIMQRRSPSPLEEDIEEVVWTPSMYQKWDRHKKLGKRKASDSDTDRPRPKSLKFQRSASIEQKKSTELLKHKNQKSPLKMQRSVSTIETVSAAFGKPSISWPASSLPKIPKLKKSESKPDQ